MWRRVDKVIVATGAFKKYMIKNKIPPEKIEIIEECIDLSMFTNIEVEKSPINIRKKYGIKNDIPIIMNHGLMAKMKGLEIMIYAVEKVKKSGVIAKFILVGAGPEYMHIKSLAREMHLEDDIIFTGWVAFDKIPYYISQCDLGIVMRNGNLGNNFIITTALMQYWAVKMPVIAPDLIAIREVVQGSKGGLLYQPQNPDDLAEKIIYALKKLNAIKEMGINGYNYVRENFNIEKIAKEIKEILTE